MKLSANDIKEIRSTFRKAENAAEARVALANRYGVTPAQVDSITEGVERDQHHRPNSKAFDVELFKKLYESGMNDKDIATRMGFTPSTVFTHRTKLGLPPQNRKTNAKKTVPAESVKEIAQQEAKKKDIGPVVFDVFYQAATVCLEEHRDIRNNWQSALNYCNSKLGQLSEIFNLDDETDVADYLYQAVLTGAVMEVPEEC